MKKLVFVLFVILLVTTSCAGSYTITKVAKTRQIELGMTKNEVVSILGKDYKPASAIREKGVLKESISYNAGYDGEEYIYFFENNVLIEWKKEVLRKKYMDTTSSSEKKE